MCVSVQNTNGRMDWKTQEGITLKELEEKEALITL